MREPRPADHARRESALDPGRSFIVQAPAGSGKTTLLVQRFLRLLCHVDQPERVLAITFTRKAAAEMRRRIALALNQAREGVPETAREALAADKRRTLALAERVFESDQQRPAGERWELDRYPARLRVMTFDALCLELASRMPVLSRFGTVPEPTEEDEPLALEAALRTLGGLHDPDDPVRADVEALLDYLDNDWAKAQRLLADMLRRRGQWRLDPGRPPSRGELDRALAFSVRHFFERLAGRFSDAVAGELAPLADHAGANLREAGMDSPITALAGCRELPVSDDRAGWRGLAELLLKSDGHWRRSVNKNQGFKAGKAGKPFKDRFDALMSSLAPDERLRDLLRTVKTVPAAGYDERQAGVLRSLHSVLVRALTEMRVVVSERGQSDFSEIALCAEQALGRADAPSELLLRLDYMLDHLLVDEFQDTSWSQYRLLSRLTEGWQVDDGRTLFLVGDPMQSIYRFRDADVGLFIDVWQQRRLGAVALEPLSLSVNFRSAAPLVEWFNHGFRRVLPRRSDASVGAVAYTEAAPGPGAETDDSEAVACHPASDLADEARRVAAAVHELRATRPDDTIAILVRSRRHLEAVLPRLREALDRPFQGMKLEKLHEHPDVCDLLALTRALLHPADRVAWLAVLRAPWCGLSREALFMLAEHAGEGDIAEAMSGPPAFRDPGDDRALARAAPVLMAALDARHGRPLRDWVEATWLRLGGPDGCQDQRGVAAASAFLDELETLERDGDLPDPPWLEQRLVQRFVPPDPLADDRVQVMTMHQAKGLEFDHVLLPGLDRHGRRDEDPLQVWHDQPGADVTERTLAAVMDPPEIPPGTPTVYGFVRALEQERHDYELARLLYVACTRAGRSLHLFAVPDRDQASGEVREPDRRSLLKRLWPVTGEAFARVPATAGDGTADDLDTIEEPPLKRLADDWSPPEPRPDVRGAGGDVAPGADAPPVEYAWVGEPGRIAGVVVHEYLRRIAAEGLERWDAQAVTARRDAFGRRLRQHGLSGEKLKEMSDRVTRALTSAVSLDPGRWILGDRDSARNEYALSCLEGRRLRTVVLDRTFVDDDGVRWIVDYKAGERRGEVEEFLQEEVRRYRAQLERYAEVMRRLEGADRPLRVALYYPLLGEMRDWEPGAG